MKEQYNRKLKKLQTSLHIHECFAKSVSHPWKVFCSVNFNFSPISGINGTVNDLV